MLHKKSYILYMHDFKLKLIREKIQFFKQLYLRRENIKIRIVYMKLRIRQIRRFLQAFLPQ